MTGILERDRRSFITAFSRSAIDDLPPTGPSRQDLFLSSSPCRMLEERDELLDRVFHAEEFAERRITADDAIAEDTAEALVVARVAISQLADAGDHSPAALAYVAAALAEVEILPMPISSACVAE